MDSSSSWTQQAQSGTLAVSASDVWRIQAVGSTISAYQNGRWSASPAHSGPADHGAERALRESVSTRNNNLERRHGSVRLRDDD
jgi:hypothetical protein